MVATAKRGRGGTDRLHVHQACVFTRIMEKYPELKFTPDRLRAIRRRTCIGWFSTA